MGSYRTAIVVSLVLLACPAPAQATFPGANGKLVFVGYVEPNTSDLFSVNPDGTGLTRLTNQLGDESGPTWSPDGTKIAFSGYYGGNFDIYVMNADGAGVTRLTTDPAGDHAPAWSPDGSKIVFTSNRNPLNGYSDIYTMNADGSGVTQLTNDSGDELDPDWSPTGTRIAFYQETSGNLYTIDATASPKTEVTSGALDCWGAPEYWWPSWSPDGERLAFTLRGYENCDFGTFAYAVGTIKADGTEPQILGAVPEESLLFYQWPAWSPDGARIAVDIEDRIHLIDSDDGGNQTFVANGIEPDWQPVRPPGYARPISATPSTVALVPAYKSCTSANSTHGTPLAQPSCNPPVEQSTYVTTGHGDGHPAPANFNGRVTMTVVGESPINPSNGDQADIRLTATIKDVRNYDFTDYTGELRVTPTFRITDRYNGAQYSPPIHPATATEMPFGFTLSCTTTAGGTIGSTCSATTTADAVMPGVVLEGKRAVWELGRVKVYDGGADGDADTAGDNTLFAVQGLFAP